MPYRICKTFEIESAHILSKHPEKCKYPHGHSRKLEVVLRANELDHADMVCDFKAVKLAIGKFIDSFDHAICVNSGDPLLPALKKRPGARLIVYADHDPTTEVMARHIFDYIRNALRRESRKLIPSDKRCYRVGKNVKLERVRLWETRSSWAEYSEE
ncbi:MAG: 6-carboxytetrahydropterin synthase [Planctomycetota bacterium]